MLCQNKLPNRRVVTISFDFKIMRAVHGQGFSLGLETIALGAETGVDTEDRGLRLGHTLLVLVLSKVSIMARYSNSHEDHTLIGTCQL